MKKTLRAVLSVLLIFVMLLQVPMQAYAEGGPINSENQKPGNTVSHGVDPEQLQANSARGIGLCPILWLGVKDISAPSKADAERQIVEYCANNVQSMCSVPIQFNGGEHVASRGILNMPGYAALWDEMKKNRYYTDVSEMPAVCQDWAANIAGGGYSSSSAYKGDMDILTGLFSFMVFKGAMGQDQLTDFIANLNAEGSGTYYFMVWCWGYLSYGPKDGVVKTTPSKLYSGPCATTGYSSFSGFKSAYMGGWRNTFVGEAASGYRDRLLSSSYITDGTKNWYGRGYWGFLDGGNLFPPPPGTPPPPGNPPPPPPPNPMTIEYSMEGYPKDRMADLSQEQVAGWPVHLYKGAGCTINPVNEYWVTFKFSANTVYSAPEGYTNPDALRIPPKLYALGFIDSSGSNGKLEDIGVLDTQCTSGYDTANCTFKARLTGELLERCLSGEWWFNFASNSLTTDPTKNMWSPLSVEVTVSNISNSRNRFTTKPRETEDWFGYKWDAPSGKASNYASWKAPSDGRDIPWEWHSSYDPNAYAEIVANEVKHEDWNAMQGIPSTENLSVAAGGTLNMADFSGWVHIRGTELAGAPNNVGQGANMPGIINRDITINVKVVDTWGDNPLCSLSCSGHTKSVAANGSGDTKCTVCGVTPGYEAPPAGSPPGTKGPAKNCGCSGLTLTASCSTGQATVTGGTKSGELSINGTKQQYIGKVTATAVGGATAEVVISDKGEQCLGYTTGTGCACSAPHNVAHPGEETRTFHIKETLDLIAWKEITSGCVYTLTDAEITAVDSNVISDGVIGWNTTSSSGTNSMWRAKGLPDGSTNPDSILGRLWYTQFVSAESAKGALGSGCDGVSYVDTTSGRLSYFLTNATVTITVKSDKSVQDLANPGVLDSVSVKDANGIAAGNHETPTSTGVSYKNSKGDKSSPAGITNEALHVVNAWQNMMSGKNFTIMVLSDCVSLGSHYTGVGGGQKGYQNIVNGFYTVDNGIKLFDYPFTAVDEWHYRNHKSQYSADTLEGMANGAFTDRPHSGNAIVGYLGNPKASTDPTKYGYAGDSIGSLDCFSNSITHADDIYAAIPNAAGDWRISCDGTLVRVPFGIINSNISMSSTPSKPGVSYISYACVHDHPSFEVKEQTEEKYWSTHTYGSKHINARSKVQDNCKAQAYVLNDVTDCGKTNVSTYGTPYVISNIDIKDVARNDEYNDAITVMCNWRRTLDFANQSTQNGCGDQRDKIPDRCNGNDVFSKKGVYSNSYRNTAGNTGVINDFIVHNPVTVEYSQLIGNGYGSYGSGIVDESGEDMRYYTTFNADGSFNEYTIDNEADKNNYIVMGNTFHLWISDVGDFRDTGGSMSAVSNVSSFMGVGSPAPGYDSSTGDIVKGGKGYVDRMNTSIWSAGHYVQFEFPVSYVDKSGKTVAVAPGVTINLADVKCRAEDGSLGCVMKDLGNVDEGNYTGTLLYKPTATDPFHKGQSSLESFKSDDKEFRYGLDFEFTLLPSASEKKGAYVKIFTDTINMPDGDSYELMDDNAKRDLGYASPHGIYRETYVDVVGRIGNLALEDVGDFRFSELFKKYDDAGNAWLIPGVIHKVNSSLPDKIIATKYDILGNDTTIKISENPTVYRYDHAQASITNYVFGGTHDLGKAGPWLPFPLVASQNPVLEYSKEQMRMGYYAYFDIETMGNYYGNNLTDDTESTMDRGPLSVDQLIDSAFKDTRNYVMDIVPKYYLYDMGTEEFVNINMYYGNQGDRTLFWCNGEDIHTDISALYNDLNGEMGRRNTNRSEVKLTEMVLSKIGPAVRASAFGGDDFIGTASHIRLDAFDRSFIGTTLRDDWVNEKPDGTMSGGHIPGSPDGIASEWFTDSKWTSNATRPNDENGWFSDAQFAQQQQRWYFTLGLPSSTYVTYADPNLKNQAEIEKSHNKLFEEHGNSVIICYLDIKVKGLVWNLKYDASAVQDTSNYPPILPGDPDTPPTPFPQPDPNPPGPNPPGPNDPPVIPPDWQPVIVYDPEHTSAEDWDTYGTH